MTLAVTSAPTATVQQQRRVQLYRPLSWAVLRAPLLPVQDYLRIAESGSDERRSFLNEDLIRTAVAVGSPDLLDALERGREGKERDRQDSSLLRYLIRMSSRPTPYGMFAGVALVPWGERTTAVLAGMPSTHTRPDMSWLIELLAAATADPDIHRQMRVCANRAVVTRGGRVFVMDQPTSAPTSVRATAAVARVMRLATRPIRYADLVQALLVTPGANTEKVETLLDEMLRQSLLFTELQPSLVTADPATDAALILRSIPAARERATALEGALDDLSRFDQELLAGGAAKAFAALTLKTRALQPETSTPMQVDMTWPVCGAITARIGEAAAHAAETLLSLSPSPSGPPSLHGFKRAFEVRYGHQRYVPILEVLDPAVGLGPPAGGGHSSIPPERAARRSRRLMDLAVDALRDRHTVVDLTDEDLDDLRTGEVDRDSLPLSLELSLFVLAATVDDIDSGQFQLVVGPNLGAPAAGRNLGRFASALGPAAMVALREVAEHEAGLLPGRAWAEVGYLPSRARSANVAVRPSTRPFDIVSFIGPERQGRTSIPLDELSVGLHGNRLRVVWTRNDTEVVPCAGHMLNTRGAPPAVALLDEIARDGRVQVSSFDWGSASSMPALPRVSHGGLVLQPAQWTLDRRALRLGDDDRALPGFADRFDTWRERWSMPRHVYVAFGDNRLLLDLDQPSNVAEVRRELARLRTRGSLVLQEALPGPEHAWLTGPSGRYLCELVIPVVRTTAPVPDPSSAQIGKELTTEAAPVIPVSVDSRLKLPGSEWLYVKLYVPIDVEDDLLTDEVRDFTELSMLAGAADSWFFLRYSDPTPHLRLRFHGNPQQLTELLVPRLFRWAAKLQSAQMCTALVLDTYDREVERYGGEKGVEVAEAIYCADSPLVLELLEVSGLPGADLDRLTLAAVSIDDLLDSLGYDIAERTRWYAAQVRDRRASGGEYRHRGNTLRDLVGEPRTLSARVGGVQALAGLGNRRHAITALGAELAVLEDEGELAVTKDALVASLVHLHCNRLLGRNTGEDLPLGLLLRTWQGLQARESVEAVPGRC